MTPYRDLLVRISAVRVAIWTLVALAVLGHLGGRLGSPPRPPGNDTAMGTSKGDPRVVQRDYQRLPNAISVAWIIDSSVQILRLKGGGPDSFETVSTIPERILAREPAINGRQLTFAMYTQPFGPKAIDKYFETQQALSLKPDLLIYGVNPTFDFTPWEMMGEENSPGALSTFGGRESLKLTLLFATPAQVVQGGLGRLLPAVEKRFDLGRIMEDFRQRLDPFNFRSVPARTPPNAGWRMYRWRAYHTGLFRKSDPNEPASQYLHLTSMRLMDLRDESLGKEILRDLVADLHDSGTQAIIYMIPINLAAVDADPVAAANFHAIEQWFADFAARNTYGNVSIVPRTPSRFLDGISFYDTSHTTNPAPFVDYMATEIGKHVPQKN